MLVVAALSLLAMALSYKMGAGSLARADTVFWLKYFLSSQSAILWMSMMFFMSTAFYWIGMFRAGQAVAMEGMGSQTGLGGGGHGPDRHHGALVRELPDRPGCRPHPVSNLYEVFVLFCWMTAAFYLYYEAAVQHRALGAFVMLVVSAAVGFPALVHRGARGA
jgi:ABC-type transport system involved in cytochrome c biogenesis permease subunit